MARPTATFRVYPERRTLYFEVRVYRTKREMLRAARRVELVGLANDTVAHCTCYPMGSNYRRDRRRIGRIFLYRGALDPDTVSHECLHAALGYLCRRGIKTIAVTDQEAAPDEERLCTCLGQMVGDIARRFGV